MISAIKQEDRKNYGADLDFAHNMAKQYDASRYDAEFEAYYFMDNTGPQLLGCQQGMQVMPKFKNPANGHTVYVDNTSVVLGAFFFGPLFFFCIGGLTRTGQLRNWPNPLDGLFGLLTWIGWAVAGPGIVRQKWLTRGCEEIQD